MTSETRFTARLSVLLLTLGCSGPDSAGSSSDGGAPEEGSRAAETGGSAGDGGETERDAEGGSGGLSSSTATGGAQTQPIEFEVGSTTLYVPEKDKSYETSTLGPVEGDAPLSQYGGDLSRNVGGTGFFGTTAVDGNWFFVDPDGYLYLSVGLNSVSEGGDIALPEALQGMGFNSLGNWSNYSAINGGAQKIPYTTKYSFAASFAKDDAYDGGTEYLENLLAAGVVPVVFSDFDEFCDDFATQIAALKDDPWMLGIFSDNELPFYNGSGTYGDVLDRWIALGSGDAYYDYAVDWLGDRPSPGSATSYTTEDKEDFAAHIVETYFSKVSAAIRRYDANHLYIGTRLHGAAKRQSYVMAAAGPYLDVISVNYYGAWTPDVDEMDMWLTETGKPFLISEFYVKGADSGLGNEDGAGWEVASQTDRGLFYTHWLLNFYSHPGAIGTHWFRYIDKAGQDSNKGFLSEEYEWYQPLCDAAYNTNRQIYQLVEHLR